MEIFSCAEGIERAISRMKKDHDLATTNHERKIREENPKPSRRRRAKANFAEKRKRRGWRLDTGRGWGEMFDGLREICKERDKAFWFACSAMVALFILVMVSVLTC